MPESLPEFVNCDTTTLTTPQYRERLIFKRVEIQGAIDYIPVVRQLFKKVESEWVLVVQYSVTVHTDNQGAITLHQTTI